MRLVQTGSAIDFSHSKLFSILVPHWKGGREQTIVELLEFMLIFSYVCWTLCNFSVVLYAKNDS